MPIRHRILTVVNLGLVLLVLIPVIYLSLSAVGSGSDGLDYLLRERTVRILWNSITLVVAVSMGTALIGIPFAYLTAITDLPFRRVWLVLGLLTMVIPSYLAAVSYLAVFSPVGYLQQWLEPLTGIRRLPDIRGFWGAWLSITLFTYPYVVLPVRAALLNADPALSEAAQSLGKNRWQVFYHVTLPQLRPALFGGMLLAGLYALSDFGAVTIMRYNAFTRAIYLQINAFRQERAAILALVLIALTLVLLFTEQRVNRQQPNYRVGVGTRRQQQIIQLGLWKIPALLFCGLLVLLGVGVPVSVLASWAWQSQGTVSPIDVALPELLINTMSVSAISALVVAFSAIPLALAVMRRPTRVNRWLVALAYTGNVLPGIVIALALVYFSARYLNPIYQTIPLLIIGYWMRFLPFSIAATRSALTQINPRIEEVARSLGKNSWQIVWQVTIPLARTAILAGAALVFLSTMKELPTTLILRPIGFDTLSTRIWTFYEEAFLELIGVPGLVLLGFSAGALMLLLWRDERTRS